MSLCTCHALQGPHKPFSQSNAFVTKPKQKMLNENIGIKGALFNPLVWLPNFLMYTLGKFCLLLLGSTSFHLKVSHQLGAHIGLVVFEQAPRIVFVLCKVYRTPSQSDDTSVTTCDWEAQIALFENTCAYTYDLHYISPGSIDLPSACARKIALGVTNRVSKIICNCLYA